MLLTSLEVVDLSCTLGLTLEELVSPYSVRCGGIQICLGTFPASSSLASGNLSTGIVFKRHETFILLDLMTSFNCLHI